MAKHTNAFKWGYDLGSNARHIKRNIVDTFIPPVASILSLWASFKVYDNTGSFVVSTLSFVILWYTIIFITATIIEALTKWDK